VLLPLWHPLRVAEEFAVLDVLSGGRVECGVGRGMDPGHFGAFAVEQAESAERLVEGIEILRRAWSAGTFSFEGAHHRLRDVSLAPRPVQRPHPPIRVAANSLDTLVTAGRLGLPVLLAGHINPLATLPAIVERYRNARRDAGHATAPDDVTLLLPVYVGRDAARVRTDVEPGLRRVSAVALRKVRGWLAAAEADPTATAVQARLREFTDRLSSFSYDQYADSMAVFGPPERCAGRLAALRDELGVGRFVAWFNPGGLVPHERVCETMELFAREVMPSVMSTSTAPTARSAA
jgi:alkanesulfonate monooxygenase SsuD/methylene tetrahydromethanopterin reductase-like flavin-dependent oxidoreductase (luciferase family)